MCSTIPESEIYVLAQRLKTKYKLYTEYLNSIKLDDVQKKKDLGIAVGKKITDLLNQDTNVHWNQPEHGGSNKLNLVINGKFDVETYLILKLLSESEKLSILNKYQKIRLAGYDVVDGNTPILLESVTYTPLDFLKVILCAAKKYKISIGESSENVFLKSPSVSMCIFRKVNLDLLPAIELSDGIFLIPYGETNHSAWRISYTKYQKINKILVETALPGMSECIKILKSFKRSCDWDVSSFVFSCVSWQYYESGHSNILFWINRVDRWERVAIFFLYFKNLLNSNLIKSMFSVSENVIENHQSVQISLNSFTKSLVPFALISHSKFRAVITGAFRATSGTNRKTILTKLWDEHKEEIILLLSQQKKDTLIQKTVQWFNSHYEFAQS
jgi:hypothetical protein